MNVAADELAAAWLPNAQFREHHAAVVPGPIEKVMEALSSLNDGDDVLVRLMLQLREAPVRAWDALGGRSKLKGRPRFGLHEFTLIEQRDDALVWGLAGKFWRLDFGLHPVATAAEFRDLQLPGVARLVIVNALGPRSDGNVDMVTETHVHCPDRTSLTFFAPYWCAIRLGSGLIRRRMLRMVERRMSVVTFA